MLWLTIGAAVLIGCLAAAVTGSLRIAADALLIVLLFGLVSELGATVTGRRRSQHAGG